MGIEIAKALSEQGADVTLICGPVKLDVPTHIKRIDVVTASQMLEECENVFPSTQIFVMSAAVADYKPESANIHKIKKTDKNLNINLVLNPDILSTLTANKNSSQFVVGFALETDNHLNNAINKLKKKNLDMIVLNQPGKDTGFGSVTNKVTIIDKKSNINDLPLMSKKDVAYNIVNHIVSHIHQKI